MCSYPLRSGLAAVGAVLFLAGCSGVTPTSSAQSEAAGTPRSTGITQEGETIELPTGPRTTPAPDPTTSAPPEPTPVPSTPEGETSTSDDDDDEEDENGFDQMSGNCDGDVTVDRDGETRYFTGQCGTVTVTSTGAIVTIEAAEKVVVFSQSSNVTVEKVSQAEVWGNSNNVRLESVDDVLVEGSFNIINIVQRNGSLRDNGSANIING